MTATTDSRPCTKALIEALPFFANLTEEEQQRILVHSAVKHFAKGGILYSPEQKCLGILQLCAGRVRVTLQSQTGRAVTLYSLKAGDLDILSASCIINQIAFSPVMVADEACDVLIVPSNIMKTLMDNIYVKAFIYERLTERFSDAMWSMQQIVFKNMDQRLAQGLLDEMRMVNSTTLRVTQDLLAQRINSAREVVTRLLKNFEAEGWVSLGRSEIQILNPEALTTLAAS